MPLSLQKHAAFFAAKKRAAAHVAALAGFVLLTACLLGCAATPAERPADAEALRGVDLQSASAVAPTQRPSPTPEPLIPITQPQLLVYLRRTIHDGSRTSFTRAELSLILYVSLEGAEVTDVSELALLPALETLVLKNTAVSDLSPLGDNAALFGLTVEQNAYSELPSVAPLTGLERLKSLSDLTLINSPVKNRETFLSLPLLKTLTLVDSASEADVAWLKKRLPNATLRTEPPQG